MWKEEEDGEGRGGWKEDMREKGTITLYHLYNSFSSKWSINQIHAVYILKRVTILQQKSICAQHPLLHAHSLVILKLLASIHIQSAGIATLWSRWSLQTSVSPLPFCPWDSISTISSWHSIPTIPTIPSSRPLNSVYVGCGDWVPTGSVRLCGLYTPLLPQ